MMRILDRYVVKEITLPLLLGLTVLNVALAVFWSPVHS